MDLQAGQNGTNKKQHRISIGGSSLHVSLKAEYRMGMKRTSSFRLTMNKEEAIETAAAILSCLADGARDEAMTRSGIPGNSCLRYPEFTVYDTKTREHIEDDEQGMIPEMVVKLKPIMYQKLYTKHDPNGNARKLYVLYTMTGDIFNVIENAYNTPWECRGLIELGSVEVPVNEYNGWRAIGASLERKANKRSK